MLKSEIRDRGIRTRSAHPANRCVVSDLMVISVRGFLLHFFCCSCNFLFVAGWAFAKKVWALDQVKKQREE